MIVFEMTKPMKTTSVAIRDEETGSHCTQLEHPRRRLGFIQRVMLSQVKPLADSKHNSRCI